MSCSAPVHAPIALPSPVRQHQPAAAARHRAFQLQSVYAEEPDAPALLTVAQTPADPSFELRFETNPAAAGAIRIPADGAFKVELEAGANFAILDGDASDGLARIQVPAGTLDLYLHPEAAMPPLCQTGGGSGASLADQMDRLVLAKIDSLVAQGKGACTYLPPANQRQNANCNSTSSGLQCSGPLNKSLSAASCPEIAVYAGAMNLNHALPNTRLFVATSNTLTLNQAAKGILATRGNLNTSLNSGQLEGVFVGGSSNNLNLYGSARMNGLLSLGNGGLSANLNNGAVFEGALCASGNLNFNRNGNSQMIYHPDVLSPWAADVPHLADLICAPRSNFYTQTTPLNCEASTSASLQLTDALYGLSQSLVSSSWYQVPRRPLPVPADWGSADGARYVLNFENHGTSALTARGYLLPQAAQVPAAVRVIPAIDCFQERPEGGYTAHLSYTNLLDHAVSLTGEANQLTPAGTGALPTSFATGQSGVFPNAPVSVDFTGTQLSWTLGARTVMAQADDPALRCPETQLGPELLIADVRLSETDVSIQGKDAPGSLVPDFAGKDVALTLTGTFKDARHQPIPLADFLFTLAPPLVQQTFIGTAPEARVLLDDSILLEATSVNATEIQAVLHTEKVPDLYLKGLHRLSVEQGDWYTDALIQIGQPVPTSLSLAPTINTIEVIRDAQHKPLHIRITGQNFMVYPNFYYATIDDKFGYAFQTEFHHDGNMNTLVHIPYPENFDVQSTHTLILATPFGIASQSF